MQLAGRPPHPALRRDIRTLTGWYERSDAPLRRSELPGGRVVLVVSFGPRMDVDGRTFTSFAAGLYDAPALTEHDGLGHGIQSYMTPLGARRFFGMPMSEITGQTVELEDLIGPVAGRTLRSGSPRRPTGPRGSTCSSARSPSAYWPRRRWRPSSSGRGTGCWRATARRRSASSRPSFGWSRRHFAVRFRDELGMPPKALARLLRFERAVKRLRAGDELADLALEAGYYDQAHFNRDFRAFAGITPTEYLAA